MLAYAHFISKKINEEIKIFRHNTEFCSKSGPGEVIGLVVMMNPGDARPMDEHLFSRLKDSEYETNELTLTAQDNTMRKVMRLIKEAYYHNEIQLPEQYSIHVENLFNIREKNSNKAKSYARNINEANELMFKSRELLDTYNFVFFAWGKLDIGSERQKEIIKRYPQAIIVNKLNCKGTLMDVSYPVHPLYMRTEYFLEASKGKIKGTSI